MMPPLDLLACPKCGGELAHADRLLHCVSCKAVFYSRDGIFELTGRDVLRSHLAAESEQKWYRWQEAARGLAAWRIRRRSRARNGVLPPDGPRESEIRRMIARVCTPGMTALDVGAADGNKSAFFPRDTRYIGIDPCPVTPTRLEPGGVLLQGVGEALPFRDGVFDVVVSIAALDCHNDAAASIAEWARVLKPGGAAAILLSVMHPRVARAFNAESRLQRLILPLAALPDVGPEGVVTQIYSALVNSGRLKAHDYAFGELEELLAPQFDIEHRHEERFRAVTILYLTARKRDRSAPGDRRRREARDVGE